MKIPSHVAVIMDGNGRWAKKQGMSRRQGHKTGVKTLKKIVKESSRLGIGCLTVFAFSTENWGRPKKEVNALMRLLVRSLRKEAEKKS